MAKITYEGHLAMRAELERLYGPMLRFVTEFVYQNPQQVPAFVSMEHFLEEYFGDDGGDDGDNESQNGEEQRNEDGIPVDLFFPL